MINGREYKVNFNECVWILIGGDKLIYNLFNILISRKGFLEIKGKCDWVEKFVIGSFLFFCFVME